MQEAIILHTFGIQVGFKVEGAHSFLVFTVWVGVVCGGSEAVWGCLREERGISGTHNRLQIAEAPRKDIVKIIAIAVLIRFKV